MGWKNVKQHYNIGHIVQVVEDKGICIGSAYVSDLIVIDPVERKVSHNSICRMDGSTNNDLQCYWDAFHDDLEKLWKLIEQPDTFDKSIPVYTYDGANITLHYCEELEWPNTTHEDRMMYANRFFLTEQEARAAALKSAEDRLSWVKAHLAETEKRRGEAAKIVEQTKADIAALSMSPNPELPVSDERKEKAPV